MTVKELRDKLHSDYFEKTFSNLYGAMAVEGQTARYLAAFEAFQRHFNADDGAEVNVYSAPGRAEIAGNHTDHQRGRVIAASVGLDVVGVVMKTGGDNVSVKSEGYKEVTVSLSALEPVKAEENTTAALIRGVLKWFELNGAQIGGFKGYFVSNVLKGSGLSSSAAFETMIGTVLSREFNGGAVSAIDVAKAGQFAENQYFGKPSGLMDQTATSVGGLLRIDFAKRDAPACVNLPPLFEKFAHTVCTVDTGGNHSDLTPDYAAIPIEMKSVAAQFGKDALIDVNEAAFQARLPELREKCGDRAVLRAIHFYSENNRVILQEKSLEREDFDGFLNLVNESGRSSYCYLQNVYSPGNVTEQGVSLAFAEAGRALNGRGAVKVHGGGFAGTILAFVPNDALDGFEAEMNRVFAPGACQRLYIRPVGAVQLY
jgi:galactokinase